MDALRRGLIGSFQLLNAAASLADIDSHWSAALPMEEIGALCLLLVRAASLPIVPSCSLPSILLGFSPLSFCLSLERLKAEGARFDEFPAMCRFIRR
jgi:hypothetical protein